VEVASAELAAFTGLLTGRLRLGMVSSVGNAAPVVERSLLAFHGRHPGVEIAVQDTGSRHMAEQVRSGELDLAFVGLFADQSPAGLAHSVLADEPLVAVVAPGHPLAGRRTVDVRDLAAAGPFIDMRPESGLRLQVDAAFDRAGVARTIAFELGTSESVVRFVGLGFGAALVPPSAIGATSDVIELPLRDRDGRHPIALVHQAPRPSAPSARAFLELLRETTAAPDRG
jgi:DNA-binding transcriptional LysR family regulator